MNNNSRPHSMKYEFPVKRAQFSITNHSSIVHSYQCFRAEVLHLKKNKITEYCRDLWMQKLHLKITFILLSLPFYKIFYLEGIVFIWSDNEWNSLLKRLGTIDLKSFLRINWSVIGNTWNFMEIWMFVFQFSKSVFCLKSSTFYLEQ